MRTNVFFSPVKTHWRAGILAAGVAIFYGTGLWWRAGMGVGAGVLLLLALAERAFWPRSTREKHIAGALLVIFALFAIPLLYHASPARDYDRFSRLLALIPIALLLRRQGLAPRVWLGSVVAGALLAAVVAGDEIRHLARAGGAHHPIQFGDLSLLTGFIALSIVVPWRQASRGQRALALVGLSAGGVASLLSGSRGGWLAIFPVALIVLREFAPLKKRYYAVAVLGVIGLALSPPVWPRLTAIVADLHAYQLGNVDTSLGLRLEMWRVAGQLIAAKPFFGWGSAGMLQFIAHAAAAGEAPAQLTQFYHLHNDFLDTAARLGAVGLTGLLLLYGLPLWHFARAWRAGNARAVVGVVVVVSFMVFSLSQTVLWHESGMMFLLLSLSLAEAVRRA